jgi:hypothetical protein
MTIPLDHRTTPVDQAALCALRALGYPATDIQSLARDQNPFAVRVPTHTTTITSGIQVQSQTLELADNSFTNAYTLDADLDHVQPHAVSAVHGFHLPDLLDQHDALAAVSGSFAYISDDPSYQPAEPALDFCARGRVITSLPTTTKPAFLVYQGQPTIRTLLAHGTLTIAGRGHRWIGSKLAQSGAPECGSLTVYGAANCRIRYTDHPRTGFVRDVDRATNITPADPSIVDCLVTWAPHGGHRVTSLHPGGGADLFAGNFVLRAHHRWAQNIRIGDTVTVTGIGGLDAEEINGGISLGPSVADAAAARTTAYDECLGTSPFRDHRCARTLISLHSQHLWFQVLDGAPLTDDFRGVTPQETAELCADQGRDPRGVYHLDGGQSSKIAFRDERTTRVLGSMHYLRWPRNDSEPFHWHGDRGRILRSGFLLTTYPLRERRW